MYKITELFMYKIASYLCKQLRVIYAQNFKLFM